MRGCKCRKFSMLVIPDEATHSTYSAPEPDPIRSLEHKEMTRVKSRESKSRSRRVTGPVDDSTGNLFEM